MLILIHGDDVVSSRKKLAEILAEHQDSQIVRLNGKSLNEEQFITVAESSSLFAEKKLIVIESLLGDLRTKAKQVVVARVIHPTIVHTIVIWEDKAIEKTTRSKYLATAKELVFPLPQELFRFLESVGREQPASLVTLFHRLIRQEEPLMILSMLLRQWRYLIVAKDLGASGFPAHQQWQAQKYTAQARSFSLDTLIAAYRQLLAIDYKMKTGETPLTAAQCIDIFLLSL